MNDSSRRRLDKVHPTLAARVQSLLETLAQLGFQVEVVQGLRTFAEQDALFAQGRSRPGMIVTRARGGQSNHNYGLAVDLVPYTNGQPNWNAALGIWATIGSEAEKLGLEWGGDWKKFVDKPHVQLGGMSVGECFSLYKRGGLAAVWAESSRRLGTPVPPEKPSSITPPSGSTGTSSSYPLLRLKARGSAVRALQEHLCAAGLLIASKVDGIFGQGTLAAVKKFQRSKGLVVDGIVGAATWEALLSTPTAMKGMMKKSVVKTMARKPSAKSRPKGGPKRGAKKTSKKR